MNGHEKRLRRSVALLIGGMMLLFGTAGYAFVDRSNIIVDNCHAINDVKTALRQDRLKSEAQTIAKLKAQGRSTILGYSIPQIKKITQRSLVRFRPSKC